MSERASTALAVDQDVELDEVALAVADEVVVEGAVALGDRLQPVVEVEDHLGQRAARRSMSTRSAVRYSIFLLLAAAVLAELHDGARRTRRGMRIVAWM